MNNQENRINWLDISRTFAILFITLNHAINRSFDYSVDEYNSMTNIENILKASLQIISRLGVPLFVMISGALLLNRKYETTEDYNRFYKNNWKKLFIATEIWLFIMYFFIYFLKPDMVHGEKIMIKNLFKTLLFIDPTTYGSMWYMEMIICVYLLIPMLSLALHKTSVAVFKPLLLLGTISGFLIPTLNGFRMLKFGAPDYSFKLSIGNLFSIYIIYLIAGYLVINDYFKRISTTIILFICFVSGSIAIAFQMFAFTKPQWYIIGYDDLFILICSIALFELIKRVGTKRNKTNLIATNISQYSFGIYCVHIIVMEAIVWKASLESFNIWTKLLFLETTSFISSILIIAILSLIKPIKKYVFLIK